MPLCLESSPVARCAIAASGTTHIIVSSGIDRPRLCGRYGGLYSAMAAWALDCFRKNDVGAKRALSRWSVRTRRRSVASVKPPAYGLTDCGGNCAFRKPFCEWPQQNVEWNRSRTILGTPP